MNETRDEDLSCSFFSVDDPINNTQETGDGFENYTAQTHSKKDVTKEGKVRFHRRKVRTTVAFQVFYSMMVTRVRSRIQTEVEGKLSGCLSRQQDKIWQWVSLGHMQVSLSSSLEGSLFMDCLDSSVTASLNRPLFLSPPLLFSLLFSSWLQLFSCANEWSRDETGEDEEELERDAAYLLLLSLPFDSPPPSVLF